MIRILLRWLLTSRTRSILLDSSLALILSMLDPLSLSVQQIHTFERWIAIATQFNYHSAGQDHLAVLLIDQTTLDTFGHDWPLPYSDIAAIGHRLACAGAVGVFFDFTLSHKYAPEADQKALRDMTSNPNRFGPPCLSDQSTGPIPIFFGRIPGINTRLQNDIAADNKTFLIQTSTEPNIYPAGATEFPDHIPEPEEVTPAFGLLRFFCGNPARQRNAPPAWCPDEAAAAYSAKPINLTWGGYAARHQAAVATATNCPETTVHPLLDGLRLLGTSWDHRCAPVLTLRGADLFRNFDFITQHGNPAKELAGRIVFVGVDLPGLEDYISSPVHELLPGVYAHAVALDNLLTYGSDYWTQPRGAALWITSGLFFLFVNIVIAHFFTPPRSFGLRTIKGCVLLIGIVGVTGAGIWALRWPISLVIVLGEYVLCSDALIELLQAALARRSIHHIPG
jgi:CHASE2 domain-containing sensor protein